MGTALVVLAVALASLADVARPIILKHHKVWSARDAMTFSVRVAPHDAIVAVALEAWELERLPDASTQNGFFSDWSISARAERVARVRYSREDVGREQAVYRFAWRGLDPGDYEIVAVLSVAGGRPVASTASTILVR